MIARDVDVARLCYLGNIGNVKKGWDGGWGLGLYYDVFANLYLRWAKAKKEQR